jgi:hypothetical protein
MNNVRKNERKNRITRDKIREGMILVIKDKEMHCFTNLFW